MAIITTQLHSSNSTARPAELEQGQLAVNSGGNLLIVGDGSNLKKENGVNTAAAAGKGYKAYRLIQQVNDYSEIIQSANFPASIVPGVRFDNLFTLTIPRTGFWLIQGRGLVTYQTTSTGIAGALSFRLFRTSDGRILSSSSTEVASGDTNTSVPAGRGLPAISATDISFMGLLNQNDQLQFGIVVNSAQSGFTRVSEFDPPQIRMSQIPTIFYAV